MENHNNLAITVGSVNSVKILWKIGNFSQLSQRTGERIESQEFEITGPNGVKQKWSLEIYPKGEDNGLKKHISLFIRLKECDMAEILAKVKFSILGEEKHAKETSVIKYQTGNGWGWGKFIPENLDAAKK